MAIKWVEDCPNKTFLPRPIPLSPHHICATAQAVAMAWRAVTPDQTSWTATWGGPERTPQ